MYTAHRTSLKLLSCCESASTGFVFPHVSKEHNFFIFKRQAVEEEFAL
jgi:hypothetical protein